MLPSTSALSPMAMLSVPSPAASVEASRPASASACAAASARAALEGLSLSDYLLAEVRRAAEILRAGGLVAFPTETVYGLGADARSPAAVARIFAVKGRPQDHPVIVHLPGAEYLGRWARDVPPLASVAAPPPRHATAAVCATSFCAALR